ncbi:MULTISPECIES: hypothetical protein [unclassified Lysinibacillus]
MTSMKSIEYIVLDELFGEMKGHINAETLENAILNFNNIPNH